MILQLFLTFLKIGAVSFGGGYGMISLIREECLRQGWLTEGELLELIAVAESTPGPIAVNMATFVGAEQAGVIGASFATLGVVLPSFIIILLVATLLSHLMKYGAVKAVLSGIRPAIVGMILATSAIMLFGLANGSTATFGAAFDLGIPIILLVLAGVYFVEKKLWGKAPSPILLILISGALGCVIYGV